MREDWTLREPDRGVPSFSRFLEERGLTLTRAETIVLQINTGFLCNQACRHCHLEAAPHRPELMDAQTASSVVAFARKNRFELIDITGGAPEMNPNLEYLLRSLSPLAPEVSLRSNLTALAEDKSGRLIDLCREHRVTVVASFPSLNRNQAESQRGRDVFDKSVEMLKKLNSVGYGRPDTGLKLHMVSNPTGAFLPVAQAEAEKRFRTDLEKRWGIVFDKLYALANSPLGRFRRWLVETGNYERYMARLVSSFNPCTIAGLMCRTLVSVSWDGFLYDCDFNQSARLFLGGKRTCVSELDAPPRAGQAIAVGEHCFACTAGSGFT